MGIDDGDHLSALRGDVVDHIFRGREVIGIPREVFLLIGVLDVQPQYIVRDVVLIKC